MAQITTIETPLIIDLAVNTGLKKAYGMQYDNGTRKLIIALEDKGTPYVIPSGVSVKLQGHRPDGAAIFKDCQVVNNQIHCVLTSYELAVPGDCCLNITLYEGKPNILESFSGNRLSSFTFKVAVPRNPLDEDAVVSTKDFSILTETILKAENALKNANEALSKANGMIKDVDALTKRNETLSNELNTQISKVNTGLSNIDKALNKIDSTLKEQVTKIDSTITNQIHRVDEALDSIQDIAKDALSDVEDAIGRANDAIDRVDELADKYDNANKYFVLKSEVGVPNGVPSLGEDGKVPLEQLPELGIGKGGTGIYVQEDLPDDIDVTEHWFKITEALDDSLLDGFSSSLYPTNVRLNNLDEAVSISWNDPTDKSWTGTKLMKREGTSKLARAASSAWTQLLNLKAKNQYSAKPFIDTEVTNGTKYYYGIFPYSDTEENTEPVYSITPTEILPNMLTDIKCDIDTNTLIPSFCKDDTVSRVVLVYREDFVPNSIEDGTAIDGYASGTPITGLENGRKYGLRFFIYNERGRCNNSMAMAFFATPKLVIKLHVPERLSIAQGQTVDLNWSVEPENERGNVTITTSVSTLTINANKTKVTATENTSIGDKTITFTVGDVVKETTVSVGYAPYTGTVSNLAAKDFGGAAYICFKKPSDAAGVRLVVNGDHAPANEEDGTYRSNYVTGTNNILYFIEEAEIGKKYYYAVFPYNSKNVYNCDSSQVVTCTATEIPPAIPELHAEVVDDLIIRVSYTIPNVDVTSMYPGINVTANLETCQNPHEIYVKVKKGDSQNIQQSNYSWYLFDYDSEWKRGSTVSHDFYMSEDIEANKDLGDGTYYLQLYAENWLMNVTHKLPPYSSESNLKEIDMNWTTKVKDYAIAGDTTFILDGCGRLYACGSNKNRVMGFTNGNDMDKITRIIFSNTNYKNDVFVDKFNALDSYSGGSLDGTLLLTHYSLDSEYYGIKQNTLCHTGEALCPPSTSNDIEFPIKNFSKHTVVKSIRCNRSGYSVVTEANKLITGGDGDLLGINHSVSSSQRFCCMSSESQYISNTKASDLTSERRYRIDTSNNLYEWKPNRKTGAWTKLLSNIANVVCGHEHALILDTSGNLHSAGINMRNYDIDSSGNYIYYASGALGISVPSAVKSGNNYIITKDADLNTYSNITSTYSTYAFVQVANGTKFKEISCGQYHSLAIDTNGNLWAFGYNDHGQIGDNTNVTKLTPVQIMSGKKFVSVKAKKDNSSAVDTDGNVWIWGDNTYGQLGNGTKIDSKVPILLKINK